MSMSAIDAVLNLCDILVESNVQLCKQIQKDGIDEENLYNHFKNTAKTIKKYSKFVKSHGSLSAKPEEEASEEYNDEEYNKLITRIEKIKQDRQNDKKWSEMDDENDELIERLNRLKPVEITDDPDSDIEEILKKEEELERQRDEYLEEKDKRDRLNRIEPVEPDPDFEFEELNKIADELLINSRRMKKKEFTKKLDIFNSNEEKINK